METCDEETNVCATLPEGSGGDGSELGSSGGLPGTGAALGSGGSVGEAATGGGGGTVEQPPPVAPGDYACEPGVLPGVTKRLQNWQYDHTVRDLLGVTQLELDGGVVPSTLLVHDLAGPLTDEARAAYQAVAEKIAAQVMTSDARDRFVPCSTEERECLEMAIDDFGSRAFRRPLSISERGELEALIPEELSGEGDAVATELLTTILVSPHFLDREIVGDGGGPSDSFELTSYELATRLSYFVLGSLPDDLLTEAAATNELGTGEQLAAQTTRLLALPEAAAAVRQFHRQYLGIRAASHWFLHDHDPTVFPAFGADVRDTAVAELDAFFEHVAFSRGTFADLFLSNQGFVDASLAPIYGLDPAQFGIELEPTLLDPTERPGFLTRVAFLSSFSSYAQTSPILRGSYLEASVLGVPLPPPDIGLTPLLPDGEFSTNRQKVEALTSAEPCTHCHEAYINPAGFALENYDAIGTWQTVDSLGGPIDPVADVFFGDGARTIETPLELMQALATSEHARRRYVDALVSFAFERSTNAIDACLSEELMDLMRSEAPLLDLWPRVAASESFRRGGVQP